MKHVLPLSLLMALMMFPQIVETIYSPALPAIANAFVVSDAQAGQTLSWYFFAFAVGVVFWGYCCDILGRRKTTLIALTVYGIASLLACYSPHFTFLLLCRMLMAFAAAIGSIGTQTMIRDRLSGDALRYVFSKMGIAMAISPIVGLISGSILVDMGSYQAVFWSLAIIAWVLLMWSALALPETMSANYQRPAFWQTAIEMLQDKVIWQGVLMIGLLNIALFSYYQLAPFLFLKLGFDTAAFGFSGILMALATLLGAVLNRYWIHQQLSSQVIIQRACVLLAFSSVLVWLLQQHIVFIVPIMGVVMAYGLVIPNVLAHVLKNYTTRLGTAGALLGLWYYLVIGLGLTLVAMSQNLGLSLCMIAFLLLLISRQKWQRV